MRLDKAVLKVLSDILDEELDEEKLLGVSTISSLAQQDSKDNMNYTIIANIPEVRKTPVGVEISFSGQGSLGGSTKRTVSSPSEVKWDWTFLDSDEKVSFTIKRKDSNACTRLYIESDNFVGTYEGNINVAFPEFEYFIEDFTTTGSVRNIEVPVTIIIDDKGDATFSFSSKGNIDFSVPDFPLSMDYNASGEIPGSIDKDANLKFEGEYVGSYKINASGVPKEFSGNLSGQMTGLCSVDGKLDKNIITGIANFTSGEGHTSSASYTAKKVK